MLIACFMYNILLFYRVDGCFYPAIMASSQRFSEVVKHRINVTAGLDCFPAQMIHIVNSAVYCASGKHVSQTSDGALLFGDMTVTRLHI